MLSTRDSPGLEVFRPAPNGRTGNDGDRDKTSNTEAWLVHLEGRPLFFFLGPSFIEKIAIVKSCTVEVTNRLNKILLYLSHDHNAKT